MEDLGPTEHSEGIHLVLKSYGSVMETNTVTELNDEQPRAEEEKAGSEIDEAVEVLKIQMERDSIDVKRQDRLCGKNQNR